MSKLLTAVLAALGAGGVAAAGAGIYLSRSRRTIADAQAAVASGGTVKIHATGYWPFTASAAERKMEGGIEGAAAWNGRRVVDPSTGRRVQLHTLEQFLAGSAPFVALSGDPAVWPFGQRLVLSPWPSVIFRVVDTGGHFTGTSKVFRVVGEEPLDICVNSSATPVPKKGVTARIIAGDNWEYGKAVAVANLRDQTVVGAATDKEALARAIQSTCGPRVDPAEATAIAWVCRNRAKRLGVSVTDLVAPGGVFGPRGDAFVATDRAPSDAAREVAREVLASADDPTDGAVDFWKPAQQDRLAKLGAAHRLALAAGDAATAERLAPFAPYVAGAEETREALRASGLAPCLVVGDVEVLQETG